jgi:hypothetical protein
MTLKQQIEATIAAYQEACKLKNLNIRYCNKNGIYSGLCFYTDIKGLFNLKDKIQDYYFSHYITETPDDIFNGKKKYFKTIRLYKAHQTRLKYLQNLLNEINQ